MAVFAQLDKNNIVETVIIIDDNDCLNEAIGIKFCQALFGESKTWIQTEESGLIRKNYAGIGYSYDKFMDAFIAPKPTELHTLNEITCKWIIQ